MSQVLFRICCAVGWFLFALPFGAGAEPALKGTFQGSRGEATVGEAVLCNLLLEPGEGKTIRGLQVEPLDSSAWAFLNPQALPDSLDRPLNVSITAVPLQAGAIRPGALLRFSAEGAPGILLLEAADAIEVAGMPDRITASLLPDRENAQPGAEVRFTLQVQNGSPFPLATVSFHPLGEGLEVAGGPAPFSVPAGQSASREIRANMTIEDPAPAFEVVYGWVDGRGQPGELRQVVSAHLQPAQAASRQIWEDAKFFLSFLLGAVIAFIGGLATDWKEARAKHKVRLEELRFQLARSAQQATDAVEQGTAFDLSGLISAAYSDRLGPLLRKGKEKSLYAPVNDLIRAGNLYNRWLGQRSGREYADDLKRAADQLRQALE
jgi:hypothetical protein